MRELFAIDERFGADDRTSEFAQLFEIAEPIVNPKGDIGMAMTKGANQLQIRAFSRYFNES